MDIRNRLKFTSFLFPWFTAAAVVIQIQIRSVSSHKANNKLILNLYLTLLLGGGGGGYGGSGRGGGGGGAYGGS